MDEGALSLARLSKIPPASPQERFDDFLKHIFRFRLSERDFDGNILVVGSGDMSFAHEAQNAGVPPGRIMGIEIAPDEYTLAGLHPLDHSREGTSRSVHMSLYNGDVRDMSGVPDGSFKLVLSHQAPPAVFYSWLKPGSRKVHHDGLHARTYQREAHPDRVSESIYRCLREMLRVTTVDGEIKIWPMYLSSHSKDLNLIVFNKHIRVALRKLKEEFNFTTSRLMTGDSDTLHCLCIKKILNPRS